MLYGNVYCFICGTYVYDDELEQIGVDEADKAAWIAGCGKRKYFDWQPNDLETALLTMTTKRRKISKDSIVGEILFALSFNPLRLFSDLQHKILISSFYLCFSLTFIIISIIIKYFSRIIPQLY